MSSIAYIVVYLFLIAVLYNFSKNIIPHISQKQFWRYAIIPILAYAVIEGCRYGRGVDYLSYKYRFEHIIVAEEPQLLFLWLMKFLKSINFNYVLAFITYSLIFITGTFFFIRKSFTKEEGQWMYIFAVISMTIYAENLVRQFVAQPFIFCFIPFLFKKADWWKAACLSLVAINIHTGVVIQIPILIISYYFFRKTLDWKIWIFILFASYYILPQGILSNVSIKLLTMLRLDNLLVSDHVLHYIEDSDRWLGDGSVLEKAEQTFFTMTLQFVFEASIIMASCIALKVRPCKNVLFLFNISVLGFVLCRLFHGYEIFYRMTQQLHFYWFIPAGYSLFVYKAMQKELFAAKLLKPMRIAVFSFITYQVMFWGRFIFLNPKALFFWDIS